MTAPFAELEEATEVLYPVDPKDADPRSEEQRQLGFRRMAKMLCPAVHITAFNNDAKRTRWEVAKAHRLGMTAGEPDLECRWSGPGIAYIEFKSGTGTISPAQHEILNSLARMGFNVGVFRQERSALEFLKRCGAPFVEDWR